MVCVPLLVYLLDVPFIHLKSLKGFFIFFFFKMMIQEAVKFGSCCSKARITFIFRTKICN